jgi:hypothetical protein
VITIKKYMVLIMNVDQIKAKLKSGEHILTEKKDKLKVKYENHFVKCEMQLLMRKLVLFIV